MLRPAILLMAMLSPMACKSADRIQQLQADPAMAELILIQDADPARALEAALRRGDKRFLAVAGFAVWVPGADSEEYDELVDEKYGKRVIYGTGNTYTDEAHKDLIRGAERYAERYNTLLLRQLGRTGGH